MKKKTAQKTFLLGDLSPITPNQKMKRLGRGDASGHGGTSTQGHKGQKARAGGYHKRGFEGGQMPLSRRLPKRGFTNVFRKFVGIVNLDKLSLLPAKAEVTLELVKEKGWVSNRADALKILGDGELTKSLTIKTNLVSQTAKAKIEKAGGNITLLPIK